MFKNNVIKKEVMKVIKARINAVQEAHDNDIHAIEVDHENTIKSLNENHIATKEACTRRHVESIIGKIL